MCRRGRWYANSHHRRRSPSLLNNPIKPVGELLPFFLWIYPESKNVSFKITISSRSFILPEAVVYMISPSSTSTDSMSVVVCRKLLACILLRMTKAHSLSPLEYNNSVPSISARSWKIYRNLLNSIEYPFGFFEYVQDCMWGGEDDGFGFWICP